MAQPPSLPPARSLFSLRSTPVLSSGQWRCPPVRMQQQVRVFRESVHVCVPGKGVLG